jgi:hypothetical protein
MNSVVLCCPSTIDKNVYCIKFHARLDALEVEEAMLNHRDLALVMPAARYIDLKEHRTVLQGRVIVSRAGVSLEQLLRKDNVALRSSKDLVRPSLHFACS